MSAAEPEEGVRPVSLEAAKVVLVDREESSRTLLDDTLREIAFRHIANCDNLGQFAVMLGIEKPDLVFIDVDSHPEHACQTIRGIREGEVGQDPFVVVVALTGRPDVDSVEAALAAGADDMLVKPVSARALQERIVTQIDSRKEFIATQDYLGPDRRAELRDLDADDLISIVVPNALRFAATGDVSAAPSEERVQEILHHLSIQKFYHLSQKIARIAGQKRDLMARSKEPVNTAWVVQEISGAFAEIEVLVGTQEFQIVAQIVASARQALADIQACGDHATPKHFDLLQAHGNSIGVVLQENAETAGALVSALEQAVSTIKEAPGAPKPAPAAPTELPPEMDSTPDPEPEAAGPETPASFRVRLRAWWNGVDPGELEATTE